MRKEALVKKLEAEIYRPIEVERGEKVRDRADFRNGLRKAIEIVRQYTGWQDEPAEEVSVTAIAVKASGGEKAWNRLTATQRQERLENARDVIAAAGFVPRHDYWQAILTAPKDGTKVLLFVEQEFSGKYPNRSFFITDAYCDDEGDWMSTWGHDTVESVAYNMSDFKVNPTHWMPLPPKPE